jgi:hypothetical protein
MNYSAATLVKNKAATLEKWYDLAVRGSNRMVLPPSVYAIKEKDRGSAFAKRQGISDFVEMSQCVLHHTNNRNFSIRYSIDEIRTLNSILVYFIEYKLPYENVYNTTEVNYFRSACMQLGFILALHRYNWLVCNAVQKPVVYKTATFATKAGYPVMEMKIPQSNPSGRLKLGNKWYSVVLADPMGNESMIQIMRFFSTKIKAIETGQGIKFDKAYPQQSMWEYFSNYLKTDTCREPKHNPNTALRYKVEEQ